MEHKCLAQEVQEFRDKVQQLFISDESLTPAEIATTIVDLEVEEERIQRVSGLLRDRLLQAHNMLRDYRTHYARMMEKARA